MCWCPPGTLILSCRRLGPKWLRILTLILIILVVTVILATIVIGMLAIIIVAAAPNTQPLG